MAYTSVVSKKSKDLQDKGNLTGALLDFSNLLKVGPQVEEAVGSGDFAAMDSQYDKAVQENMGARLEGPSEIEESKQVAADIHQDQRWSDVIKNRAGANAYTSPELNEERELEELSAFAESKGKSPEQVARDPRLYEEFGRHMGKKYMVLSPDKYVEYDEHGNSPTGQRVDTPYYAPQHLSNILPEDNFVFTGPKTPEESIANSLARKVHESMQETLTAGSYGPSIQSEISSRVDEEGNYNAKQFTDFILKYVTGYASIAEQDPSAGRMFSDIGFHALLAQAKKNVWQHKLEEEQKAAEGAAPTFDDRVMTSIAHDLEIGHMTLESLGNEKPTQEEAGMAGSFVRHLVGYALGKEEGKTDESSLFEISSTTNEEGRKVKTLVLTKHGLDTAQQLQPLTNELIPSSVKRVRTTLKPLEYYEDTSKAVSRKLRGIKGLDHGDLSERLGWLQVQENTPVKIHAETVNLIKALHYNIEANKMFDDGSFMGIKGDGTGNKGAARNRPGFVYKRDKHGRIVDEAGNPTKDLELAAKVTDVSDAIKDSDFIQQLKWGLEYAEKDESGNAKRFFYDYFYGFNNRLYVDQTIGNFQGSKMARGMIASGIESIYDLRAGSKDLTVLKAGIMKRFGYDKKGVEDAAAQFDLHINDWVNAYQDAGGAGGVKIMEFAGNEEGWASLAAIAEGVKLQQAIVNKRPTYSSGFLTEIDGLTNGMAWSAMQSGDYKVAGAANMFSKEMFENWKDGEKLQDVYEMVDENVRNNLDGLWGDKRGPETLKEFATKVVDGKFKQALKEADNEKFKQAMRIVEEHGGVLGRKFAKRPVMIFGYGAGGARIAQSVMNFLEDLYVQKPAIVDSFAAVGIDIEKDFAKPLSIYMTHAVSGSFDTVAKLSNTLSLAASLANEQGFTFTLPTNAGFVINLGKAKYKVDKDSRRTFTHATGQHRINKETGEMIPIRKRGDTYNFVKLFNRRAEGDTEGSLKAASQITVLLNHANDSININRAISNMHEKLNVAGTKHNTALQVFDGLFATPKEAGLYTNELNDVFKMINEESGHATNTYNALTFDLNPDGTKVPEAQGKEGKRMDLGISLALQRFKRKLTPEGVEEVERSGRSTWDPSLDGNAFDWNIGGNNVSLPNGQSYYVPGPSDLKEDLKVLDDSRRKIMKDLPMIYQFFWDKSRDKYS